eukprot:m.36310 g.36310  ORF g.36310 m.36310 type:complete len:72 (-) comp6659_c1_seq2:354-569(-)
MATVSELSMYQAQAMQLEQSLSMQEELLLEAKRRMESGYAPTEEVPNKQTDKQAKNNLTNQMNNNYTYYMR